MILCSTKKRASARARRACFAAIATTVLAMAALDATQVAAQDCSSLPGPIVYGRGGSAPNVLVGRLAYEIAQSSEPLTIVYKDDGACFAMESLVNGQKLVTTARYWTKEGNNIVAKSCTLPAAAIDGATATWGSMAQRADTCQGITLPADVTDRLGPISGFSLFVPNASTQQVISAEAVYYIYGLGVENPENHVAPWTVFDSIASRTTTSAAGLLLAKAVGIPLSATLYGTNTANNQGSVNFVVAAAQTGNPENGIGFASSETVDANRDKVRALAFQATGQEFGYWPDSTATSLDKINLRQGRYYLWNPHHFYAKLDGAGGEIVDANTKRWIGYITGTTPLPDNLNWLDIQIESGVVPECAMQVTRDGDVGPLASYQPDAPCGCYFEAKATGLTPDSCQECTGEGTNAACPSTAPVCRYGFCEVK